MKKLIILFVAFLMLVFCNATVSQAVIISFDPGFQGVLVGDSVDVDLVIAGLGVGCPKGYKSFPGFLDLDFLDFLSSSHCEL